MNSTGYSGQSWPDAAGRWDRFVSFDHYLEVARLAHQGTFDAVFLSDHPALQAVNTARPLHSLDPIVLFTALAARVPDIGFVITASSSYNSPYNLARRLASLDHISGGRVIWNVVSSFNPDIAANFGAAPLPPRAERYRRADEFVDVVKKLWHSWDLHAITDPQRPGDPLWDDFSARPIDHHGEFFDVRGPLNVPLGPQSHPLIAQAGASDAGIDLAGRHADLVYASLLGKQAAREFGDHLRARATAHGRDPGAIRLLPGLVPIVADTAEQARRRHEQLNGHADEAELVTAVAARFGLVAAEIGFDTVLVPELFTFDEDQQGPIGFTRAVRDLVAAEPLTLRQLARRAEGGHRLVVGTPDQVAEQILDWWRAGVVDGYTVQPPVLTDDLRLFVRDVIPLLRAAGAFATDYPESTVRSRFDIPDPVAAHTTATV
ncbi:NtaA/DmoA family FMN-dependent monooxygenase [Nocardia sp. alder85J]|uniref:NtaA/DmoA family FMN-dependent monooxygenase n=1 Tax=Nocardia sp. alder85J TaxID=2862949 RepID=UPI002252BB6D|nr:NtaA/DmoA family FMN-dependent monooxygenase [Nocardia sp. alder85J]MCX4099196.1 NtaA/DmoA family FMN-dependent monooxygenase [Nocardia sp. alder85J]